MLLQPFEEQLAPPTKFIQKSNLLGCDINIVSVENERSVALFVIENHTTQLLRIVLLRLVARESYDPMPFINERKAYARYHENLPHLASFCGTGNNVQFLSDTTGTRRWLPFEVESIESPLSSPFDYDGIYSQAYALYQQGFRYWFDRPEIERLQRHNEAYETSRTEHELVFWYFRPPRKGEEGEFMPVGMAMQIVSANISQKINKEMMGHAFIDLGFERKTYRNVRGYIVVRRTPEEISRMRNDLAKETDTHTPDTPVF